MSDVKWIKISTNIFDDEKILLIEGMPEKYTIITCWFKLLCLAGKSNNSGVFVLNDKIAYNDEMLASIFRMPVSSVRLSLNTFQSFGMIELIDGVITIPNWDKHQSLESYEKKKEYDRQYQAQKRLEKQKIVENRTTNRTSIVLLDKDIDIEEDKDIEKKEISKEKKYGFDTFWKSYPRKVGKEKCLNWFLTHKPNEELVNKMVKTLEAFKQSKQWSNPQYIPHPYTWLNRGGWDDELEVQDNSFKSTPKNPVQWEEAKGSTFEEDLELCRSHPEILDGMDRYNPERAKKIREMLKEI